MYDLEKKAEEWKHTIEFMKQQIEEVPNFPLSSPYTLVNEEGTEMSLNFRVKDRDLAQGFIQEMMYSDNKDLQNLLGIEVYQLCLQPNDVNLVSYLSELCRFCIEKGVYDPSEIGFRRD